MKNMVGISSGLFIINNKAKTMTAEYSAIENDPNYGNVPKSKSWREVYNNIYVTSSKTGKTTEWVLRNKQYQDEELAADEFIPSNDTLKEFPQLQGYTMTIFND